MTETPFWQQVMEHIPRGRRQEHEWLPRAVVVDITNVSEYFTAHHGKVADWDLRRDFPSVAPPWPIAFYEYTVPQDAEWLVEGRGAKVGILAYSDVIPGSIEEAEANGTYILVREFPS